MEGGRKGGTEGGRGEGGREGGWSEIGMLGEEGETVQSVLSKPVGEWSEGGLLEAGFYPGGRGEGKLPPKQPSFPRAPPDISTS